MPRLGFTLSRLLFRASKLNRIGWYDCYPMLRALEGILKASAGGLTTPRRFPTCPTYRLKPVLRFVDDSPQVGDGLPDIANAFLLVLRLPLGVEGGLEADFLQLFRKPLHADPPPPPRPLT